MQTKEIQQNEWQEFFDNFSRTNQGAPVGLEILGQDIGAQTEETGLTLQGITAERYAAGNTIIIMLGAKAEDHITHSISRATEVNIEQTDDGADVVVEIKSEDGATALLRFRSDKTRESANAVAH